MPEDRNGNGPDGAAAPDATESPEEAGAAIADAVDEVTAETDRLQAELDQLRDLYLRKLAEFDNFRKRIERERRDLEVRAGERLVAELVPVLDNFERALQHADETDAATFRQGITMIARQLWEVLQRQGMAVMDPLGEEFDPASHEAVERVDDADVEPGTIVAVRAKGYAFAGRLVRPALVAVAVAAEPARSDATGEPAE